MVSLGIAHATLTLCILQRGAELWLGERNRRRLLADGGQEYGQFVHLLLILAQVTWFSVMAFEVTHRPPEVWLLLLLVWAAMLLRIWCVSLLGRFWTTRVVVVPGAKLVRRGPYAVVPHPLYLLLLWEVVAFPLAWGEWRIALIFGLIHAVLLALRIRIEERALQGALPRRAWLWRDRREVHADVTTAPLVGGPGGAPDRAHGRATPDTLAGDGGP